MNETIPAQIVRYEAGVVLEERTDVLAREEPLEIRIEGHTITVTMRTPGCDRELAAGFLLTEGIVKTARDIFDITSCVASGGAGTGNAIDVGLRNPAAFDVTGLARHVLTSSSCGLCGKTAIDAVMKRRRRLRDPVRIPADLIFSLPRRLSEEQKTFQSTGGLHACALFDERGQLIAIREDVGRHNAFDKLIGFALLEKRTPLRGHIALLSGRASFEMMQKAHAAGIPIVAAISAPSSLAVEFARQSGQTLAGFLRGRSMNLYAGARRIV
ncbi:MAG: formate dehydrogenase accessory sulfurtransferase FdhD [Chthoniobacteraceae bacterium]